MRSPRAWVGHQLREAGVIRPVVDRFTDSQLEQLHSLLAQEIAPMVPAADAPIPAHQLEQIRTLVSGEVRSAIETTSSPFTVAQLEDIRATVASALAQITASTAGPTSVLDMYASTAPSAQLAVDIFPGEWSSELPASLGVKSGESGLFADTRIDRVIEWLGDAVVGARVLELGPLEAGHTFMLDRAGANILAVESNSRAFLKCLIVKELLEMSHSHFVRGDFMSYLTETSEHFDLVLASGVLYHMVDPVDLLKCAADSTDRLVVWTHYYAETLQQSAMARQFQAEPEPLPFGETNYDLHPREYREALDWGGFCGGPETYARWMERDDILDCLGRLGFSDITISHDHPNHPNGPAFLLLARR